MIVVLGGSGYVGSAIVEALGRRGLAYRSVSRTDCDYTSQRQLAALLEDVRPQFLINAAGFTGRPNVDACEAAKVDCLAGNALLPGVIRSCCEQVGVPWGHVSSGCIYTGCRPDGAGFGEDDPPNFSFRQNNCSFYSGCKALGEELLWGAENCFVWRLRIPFDHRDGSRNYISKLMRYQRLLQATNSLSHLDDFAEACVDCWQQRVPFGTYNLTNPGRVTTREVVGMIQRHGLSDRAFEFFESDQQFMAVAAKTPRSNCVLDVGKAVAVGLKLRPVEVAIDYSLRNWLWEESSGAKCTG